MFDRIGVIEFLFIGAIAVLVLRTKGGEFEAMARSVWRPAQDHRDDSAHRPLIVTMLVLAWILFLALN